MTKKFILTLVVLLIPTAVVFAQEGDPIQPEEAPEREVIREDEVDSAHMVEYNSSGELSAPSVRSADFLSGIRLNTASILGESEKEGTSPEKAKTTANKSAYNFLYYLFYKFKKVDNQVD